jgi:hypothetical protein
MTPTTKKVLIIGGLFIAGYLIITAEKIMKMKAIFEKMTLKPFSIPKNIKLINPNNYGIPTTISFDIDVKMENPTGDDFAVSGQIATLKTINISYDGKFIGTANVSIIEISVPNHNSIILHDVHVEVGISNALSNLSSLMNMDINKTSITGVIDVLGVSYNVG